MAKSKAVRIQYGALPYRSAPDAALALLLVTSRDTKRWIIPKGWPMKGLTPAKTAAREAFEEAGVRGHLDPKPIGRFIYDKRLSESGLTVPCEVTVFGLAVLRQLDTWPEAAEREARWVEPVQALELLDDEGLKELVVRFAHRHARRNGAKKTGAKTGAKKAGAKNGAKAGAAQPAPDSVTSVPTEPLGGRATTPAEGA